MACRHRRRSRVFLWRAAISNWQFVPQCSSHDLRQRFHALKMHRQPTAYDSQYTPQINTKYDDTCLMTIFQNNSRKLVLECLYSGQTCSQVLTVRVRVQVLASQVQVQVLASQVLASQVQVLASQVQVQVQVLNLRVQVQVQVRDSMSQPVFLVISKNFQL